MAGVGRLLVHSREPAYTELWPPEGWWGADPTDKPRTGSAVGSAGSAGSGVGSSVGSSAPRRWDLVLGTTVADRSDDRDDRKHGAGTAMSTPTLRIFGVLCCVCLCREVLAMEDGVAAPIRTVAAGIMTAGIAIAFVQWIQGVTGQGNQELQVTVEEFHRHGVASVDDLRELNEAGLWGEFDSASMCLVCAS